MFDGAWHSEGVAIADAFNLNSSTTSMVHSLNPSLDLWSANHKSGQLGFLCQLKSWSFSNRTSLETHKKF